MARTLKFIPGSTVRWRAERFIVVDYADMDSIIARELGKRRLERIPVQEAVPDRIPGDRAGWTPDLASIPEDAWQESVKRFKILKPRIRLNEPLKGSTRLQMHLASIQRPYIGGWMRMRGSVASSA